MAREARKLSKSGNYYVELKGEMLFETDADKKAFIEILEKNFATGIVRGYELLENEIRLVVKEGERGISMTMKSITTSYARYFNRANNKEGKLFSGRFKSEPLETEDEINEHIANLKNGTNKKSVPAKKVAVKNQAMPKKTAVSKKTEVKKEDIEKTEEKTIKKPQKNTKNLPSWLL